MGHVVMSFCLCANIEVHMLKSLVQVSKIGLRLSPLVGMFSMLSGCDLFSSDLFSSSSVNTIGSHYDDTADVGYCRQFLSERVPNASELYSNCLSQRRHGGHRGGGDRGPSGCVEGGPLDHRSVCTTRTDYSGRDVRECVEIPNCRRPYDDGDRHFFPSASVSIGQNIKGFAVQSFRNGVSSVVNATAANTPTVAEALRNITPEKMVLVDGMSLASAKIVRSAILTAFDGDSSQLERLGFTPDEVEGLLARNDASSASEERYAVIAQKLDMPGSTLKAFVSKALGVVIDTRWEVYNQQNHGEN
jgi:hypothetical protein